MNQQDQSIQSSQNIVLSGQPSPFSQNHQEKLADYHVEFFCVADSKSKYYSLLFASKAQNDVVLQHIRSIFLNAHGEQTNPISDPNMMPAGKSCCLKSLALVRKTIY